MKQAIDHQARPAWHVPHADMRTDSYVLLASLLNGPPDSDVVDMVRNLRWAEDLPEKVTEALTALRRAGNACSEEAVAEEFHRLFVGLGCGELVPYGSWYLDKMIQSAPLAAIRADLGRLGIVRRADTFESEDHAGALCEIMALLSIPANRIPESEQGAFFDRHVAPWLLDFFRDLQGVNNAEFYQSAGRFGTCFLEEEKNYFHNRFA
ncbi:MAG: TorD/DmsD family molecular chaperone [Desulfobulbaceae bacterium]